MAEVSRVERTLRAWLEAQPRTLAEHIHVFVEIGAALSRDRADTGMYRYVSPANIRVSEAGEVSLTGATIAVQPVDSRVDRPNQTLDDSSRDSSPRLLAADAFERGLELDYAPPELLVGLPYDARSEQFCFCVMLFEAIHGVRPFAARRLDGPTQQWTQPARFPRRSSAPADLDRLLRRGLAVPPSERWPSLEDVVEELRALARETPQPRADRRTLVGALIAMLLLAAAAAAVVAWGS